MTARSTTMVTLHDSRFVECQWRNDGWTVKTVVTCLHDTGPWDRKAEGEPISPGLPWAMLSVYV